MNITISKMFARGYTKFTTQVQLRGNDLKSNDENLSSKFISSRYMYNIFKNQ